MALEATLILLDNSSYSLNGDYLPTRWQSQVDCAGLLIQSKLQSNIQSSVGLGLMGGRQVEILCTMTSDSTKANSYLFGVKIHGELHFTQVSQIRLQALQTGSLALKHRANQSQKQRIVCFIASTITEDVDTLKIFAKKLKKNGIAIDLICFGDCSRQQRNKVDTFIQTVNQQDNSHQMFIQPGQIYLSQKLLGTSIFTSAGVGNIGGMQVDDPQLAQAIRMSLQQSMPQLAQNNQGPRQQAQGGNPGSQGQGQRQQTEQQLEQLAITLSLEEANQQQQQQQQPQNQGNQNQKKNQDNNGEQKPPENKE